MFCNNYSPYLELQIGEQPIRVLYKWCINVCGNIRYELSKEFKQCSKVSLIYNSGRSKALSPHVVFETIIIEETFLSLLWCSCYGVMSLIPLKEVSHQESLTGEALIRYALNLLNDYTEWDKIELPNPEFYKKEDHELIGKVNMCYLIALNFIFYHEFAHLIYNDVVSTLENEKRADLFALERILAFNEDENDVKTSVLAFLTALATLTLVSSKMNGFGHPDPDQRIVYTLEKLGYPESHYSWGYASYTILLWKDIHGISLDMPNEFVNLKAFFYNLIEGLDKWKTWKF